ncbi:MAG TPA: hypothetical protein VK206_20865 [Anaerolineales bacterium]|nr:hypothetical protein [Anaerolineales bacterium]HLO32340.1 hypothetical protein [Anaerolineales bacterium]
MQTNLSEIIQELKWLEYTVQETEAALWRVQGIEGELPIGETATSDEVVNFYSTIDNLERKLSYLAMNWRGEKTHSIVKQYHEVVQNLWNLGWRGTTLLADMELPDELMPQYFISYWIKRRQDYNEKHNQ